MIDPRRCVDRNLPVFKRLSNPGSGPESKCPELGKGEQMKGGLATNFTASEAYKNGCGRCKPARFFFSKRPRFLRAKTLIARRVNAPKMSADLQAFHTLLRNFRDREMSPSVMLLLAWIVVCDDSPGEEKPVAFSRLAKGLGLGSSVSLPVIARYRDFKG